MTARHARVVIDLGAGDGKAALRRARGDSSLLSIAIDPVAAALAESSQRAARAGRKGGQINAVFLCGSAEELPWRLSGVADEIVVALPWGALLDGVLHPGGVGGTADRLRRTLKPNGTLTLLLSVTSTDRNAAADQLDAPALERLTATYVRLGFDCIEERAATLADVVELSSSWGRRLRIPGRRPAWLLRLRATPGRERLARLAAV